MKKISLLLSILLLIGCVKVDESKSKTTSSNDGVTQHTAFDKENISNWYYESSKDEMRNIETKYASINSINKVNFDFPYDGGSSLQIIIRQQNNSVPEVIFSISKGQFLCKSNDCGITYKFDNGSLKYYKLSKSSDNSSTALFIANSMDASSFIAEILKSEYLIVELPFYQSGNKQFKFDVKELKWDGIHEMSSEELMIDAAP